MLSRRFWAAGSVIALVVVAAAARFLLVRGVPSPWITPDEPLYGLLGRDLYAHGHLGVFGRRTGFYSALYPAIVGIPLLIRDLELGYTLLKGIQTLLMTMTAVPVYVWARSVARPRFAFAAAALTVAVPGLTYSGMLMTEVAFYPAVTVAAWLTARALLRPTVARQLIVLGAVGAVALIRLQGLVFLPAVLGAVLLKALLDRDLRGLRVYWPIAAVAIALGAAALIGGASSLGGYATIASSGYAPGRIASFVVYHAGGLLLACGVVPLCAVALLLSEGLRSRELPDELRAYLAVAASFSAYTVALVGTFASRYSDRIVERGLLCVVPLLMVGLAAWLDRSAPRRYATAAAIAFAASALLLFLPYNRFVSVGTVQDSMTFAAVLDLTTAHPAAGALTLLGVTGTVLAALFALVPHRAAPALVVILVGLFGAESWGAAREVRSASAVQQGRLLGADPRWIDHATDQPTAFVFAGGVTFDTAWENAFWNRSVSAVYDFPGERVLGPLPQQELQLHGDGVLRAGGRQITERFVVLPAFATPAGTRLATTTLLVGAGVESLGLWKLDGTPRLLERRGGFEANGDISFRAELHEYGCARGGTFLVTLVGKESQTVSVRLNGRPVAHVSLAPGQAHTQVVHAFAGRDGACSLTLKPSTLVGTTEARFARG